MDSDTFIQPNGIIELVQKLWSHDKYAAVCGYITPSNYKSSFVGLLQHYEHISFYGAIRTAQDKLGFVPVMAGAFVAHRASVVKELGGWSEWLVEDIAWCWKAISNQYKTGYAPKAKAKTQCPLDTKSLFKQRRRWARGVSRLIKSHGKHIGLLAYAQHRGFLLRLLNIYFHQRLFC